MAEYASKSTRIADETEIIGYFCACATSRKSYYTP